MQTQQNVNEPERWVSVVFGSALAAVKCHDSRRSHWVAKGPAGTTVDWEAEIINEIPNELIGWRSVDGSKVNNAGSVHFDPATGGAGNQSKNLAPLHPPP